MNKNIRKFSWKLVTTHLVKKFAALYGTKVFKAFFKKSQIDNILN